MAKELSEETGFNISLKSLAGIGFLMATSKRTTYTPTFRSNKNGI
jgi:hypothetical protein